ncbi:MAG: hypothetical protein S4CHLAM2_00720 [Chlamydiales bacterium]|nr:hypothetical protein [Chlamydiales bacterium]
MNPAVQNQEKIQLKWGIDLFAAFLCFAIKQGGVSPSQALSVQEELKELAQTEDSSELVTTRLNHCIERINQQLKQNTDASRFVPFPLFSFAAGVHIESSVLNQISMIERTLNEAAEAGFVSWDEESHYFEAVLKVFSEVESHKMLPQEGMARLIGELNKLNKTLPADSQVPLPNLSGYE